MKRICNVVGARPNFMKMAPVVLELIGRGVEQVLVHTGQHYDANMSDVFFEELGGCPAPTSTWTSGPTRTPARRPR